MATIIPAILALLQSIIPSLSSASAITQIIATLTSIIPVIVKEVQDVVPMVKNIIAALKSNDVITPEQMTALEALDAQCDADFETAATAAQAEDANNS